MCELKYGSTKIEAFEKVFQNCTGSKIIYKLYKIILANVF